MDSNETKTAVERVFALSEGQSQYEQALKGIQEEKSALARKLLAAHGRGPFISQGKAFVISELPARGERTETTIPVREVEYQNVVRPVEV